jgi:hypothetical protein
MILAEQAYEVERSGDFKETSFRIKASAKAFSILSSSLYSDKIKAILRELGTNAADAHVMAGVSDKPFHVHLPNRFEPQFTIRDFGTGLRPEDVENIYTVYFESNKTDSNYLTGCLGLGSKSPFSYTDNFSVTNYYNGRKYNYGAFINDDRVPTIALLGEEESSEPNGLEISFSVNEDDFYKFKTKATEVYQHFNVRPVIAGEEILWKDNVSQPVISGVNWKLYNDIGSSRVRMGNVVYPINLAECGYSNENIFSHYHITIECNIGEVEMTASRESLEYTDLTKSTLKKALAEAVDNISNSLQKELESKSTFWEAVAFVNQNSLFMRSPTWQGKAVPAYIKLPKTSENKDFFCDRVEKNFYGSKVRHRKKVYLDRLMPNKTSEIIVINDASVAVERAKVYLSKVVNNGGRTPSISIVKFDSDADKKIFFDSFYNSYPASAIIFASNLPRPTTTRNGTTKNIRTFKFVSSHNKVTQAWTPVTVNLADGGVYVELNGWECTDGRYDHRRIADLLCTLSRLGVSVTVYGLRKDIVKKLPQDGSWKTFDNFIKETVQKFSDDFEYVASLDNYLKYIGLVNNKAYFTTLKLGDLISRLEYVKKNDAKLKAISSLMYTANMSYPAKDIDKEVETAKAKYPLAFYIIEESYSLRKLPQQAIADYVNAIDRTPVVRYTEEVEYVI